MIVSSSRSLRSNFRHGLTQLTGLGGFLAGVAATVLALGQPAQAAERLHFTYGLLGRSLSIEELRDFADTGNPSQALRWYINFANLNSEDLRAVLTKEVPLDLKLVDRLTYSLPGEFLLFQTGELIHTRSRQANLQALRAALILSVVEDDQISLIEFLEMYPTEGVYIDGIVLAQVARDVRHVINDIEPVIIAVEEFLSGLICEACEPAQTPPVSP